MPVVSVIVPAYNSEKYIEETLDCLLDQTLQDIEVIIVNDGSTDSTADIASSYCAKDSRFSLINKENGGVSLARNTGLRKAGGRYVLFLDSDDILTPQSLEEFSKALDRTGADVAIGRLHSLFAEELSKCESIDKFNKTLLWNFLVGNKCYRLDSLRKSGVEFPQIGYSEEGAFFMEVIYSDAVKGITGTDKACMKYRRHDPTKDASVSQSVSEKLINDFLSAIERIYAAAEKALVNENDDKKEDYLQEILYKGDYILISQFYRLLWQTDDAMLEAIRKGHERFIARMTDETKLKVKRLNADLGEIIFDRKKVAENPYVSVIVDVNFAVTLNSVYMQTMPYFEVFVKESFFSSADFPLRWKECGNLHVLADKGFKRCAKKAAKAEKVLKLCKHKRTNPGIMRFLQKLPLPDKIKNMCYTVLFNAVETAVRIKQNG